MKLTDERVAAMKKALWDVGYKAVSDELVRDQAEKILRGEEPSSRIGTLIQGWLRDAGFLTKPGVVEGWLSVEREELRACFQEGKALPKRYLLLAIGLVGLLVAISMGFQLEAYRSATQARSPKVAAGAFGLWVSVSACYAYWLSKRRLNFWAGLVTYPWRSIVVVGVLVLSAGNLAISTMSWRLWMGTPAGWQPMDKYPTRLQCRIYGGLVERAGQGVVVTSCWPTWAQD